MTTSDEIVKARESAQEPSVLRRKLESAFLRAVRAYTFNTPISKGKYRAFLTARSLCRTTPEPTIITLRDGRRILTDLSTGMHDTVYFLGEYERSITDLICRIVKPGDTCLDVGANFGWYTTLFRMLAGPSGNVHAFEPVPPTFEDLRRNYELMDRPENVSINDLALGEVPGEMEIHLFSGLTTGHASLSPGGRDDATVFKCRVAVLDEYLSENNVPGVDVVKVDIEGGELMFLRGARRLFEQERPPVILMEMALNTTRHFGYRPDALVKFIGGQAEYSFFVIDEALGKLRPIDGFADDDIGANVLCIPSTRRDAVRSIRDWLP